jgi:hypothetical protein
MAHSRTLQNTSSFEKMEKSLEFGPAFLGEGRSNTGCCNRNAGYRCCPILKITYSMTFAWAFTLRNAGKEGLSVASG